MFKGPEVGGHWMLISTLAQPVWLWSCGTSQGTEVMYFIARGVLKGVLKGTACLWYDVTTFASVLNFGALQNLTTNVVFLKP
jgi:hypothetical protein